MSLLWNPYPHEDMDFILDKTDHHLRNLHGSSFLLTGGTGFVGSWMLQFLLYATKNLGIHISLDVVTRKSLLFSHENYPAVRFIQHDLRMPIKFDTKDYSHVIFSSTPSNPMTGGLDKKLVSESTISGTRNILELLSKQSNQVRYLNTSSGAVKKVKEIRSPEDESINDVYTKSKYEAEKLLIEASVGSRIDFCSPRLYSFAGPGIALNAHFAIGNFIQDAMNGRDVVIKGSPETVRSYLHPIDMTIQLLDCLFGQDLPIFPDIGSFNSIKLLDLAQMISKSFGNGNVVVIDDSQFPSTYVPSFHVSSLNHQYISLEETIKRWKTWLL